MLKLNFWPPKRYTFKALLCYDCVVLSIALTEVIKFSLINGNCRYDNETRNVGR